MSTQDQFNRLESALVAYKTWQDKPTGANKLEARTKLENLLRDLTCCGFTPSSYLVCHMENLLKRVIVHETINPE
jgi:hypothetical protein